MKSERARLSLSHYGHVAAIFSLVLFKRMPEYGCKNPVPKKILEIEVYTLMSVSTRMGTGCRHILRGLPKLERYNIHNSSTSCSKSDYHASYESYECPLSYGV